MKKNILIISIFTLLLMSCNSKKQVVEEKATTPIAKTEKRVDITIYGKWKMLELNGVKNDNEKLFVRFLKDGKYSGFMGCNNLGGEYKLEGTNKIFFLKGIQTLMACQDMKKDREFSTMLLGTETYLVKGTILSLMDGKQTVIAKFQLTE